MELFGIILSVPAAFVASTIYSFLLAKIVLRLEPLRRLMFAVSVAVLGAIALEVTLVVTLGAVRVRELAGPWFYAVHLLLFVLGTPALANVIVLKPRPKYFSWFVAVPFCTVLALGLVLMQYAVSEALYGIDGQKERFRGDPLSISRSRISEVAVEAELVPPQRAKALLKEAMS